MPFDTSPPDDLRASVLARISRIVTAPEQEQKFSVGPNSAKRLGYDAAEIEALPTSATESFCGVGYPLSLGQPEPGQMVLDLGCGAGLDSLLAAGRVGPQGKVIGIDMTPEMVAKARRDADRLGFSNVEFLVVLLSEVG